MIAASIPFRLAYLAVLALGASFLLLWAPAVASTDELQDRIAQKKTKLDRAQQQEGVQSSTLENISGRLDLLIGQVAALRNREAQVQSELAKVQARLSSARSDLKIARDRLQSAKSALKKQLVAIYKAEDVGAWTVILDSSGYDDMLSRATYLSSIQEEGQRIAAQVRELRDQTLATVGTIRSSRDQIASKKAELERTRQALEAQEASLAAARKRQHDALARTRTHIGSLQGDVSDLEKKVQQELQAAQQAAAAPAPVLGTGASSTSGEPSSSGLIWPVSGTVTSPFGPRWGTIHEGIDIGAAEGTPIEAAASGTVVMAGWNGGYGNYTCVDHGGGFSTCYAHQSVIGVTVGQDVSQGDVIGEVGNTGHSFGAHLHFETRVNGVAEDPMGYL